MVVGGRELIDTLWNVNAKKLGQIAGGVFRINRYIMECKCALSLALSDCGLELIDTLWNVNAFTTTDASSAVN